MELLSTQDLVHDHIDGLVREAAAERLIRLARSMDEVRPAAWRRLLGRGIRGLSVAFGAASNRLDPTVERPKRADRTPLRA